MSFFDAIFLRTQLNLQIARSWKNRSRCESLFARIFNEFSFPPHFGPGKLGLTISAGFVNRIFRCANKKQLESNSTRENGDGSTLDNSNTYCLIRLYGGKFIEGGQDNALRSIGYDGEVLAFYLMVQRKIGPKLYGVFNGGRVEEYLEHFTTLTNEDVTDSVAMAALASKFAQLHCSDVPLSKEPRDVLEFAEKSFAAHLDSYRDLVNERTKQIGYLDHDPKVIDQSLDLFNSFDFASHVESMKQLQKRIKSKVVLSQNDTNRANFMINRKVTPVTPDAIRILDYEFIGYNYRGSDLGSHFQNRRLDVAEFIQGKFGTFLPYPSREDRRSFLKSYLETCHELGVQLDPEIDTVDHLLLEAEFYAGVHELFFFSFMVSEHEKWKNVEVTNFHPVLVAAMNVQDFIDRKKETLQLLDQFGL